MELNEIEARNETYPETRGFLKLLSSLTDNPIPPSLGTGYRAPGFEPYLQFIRDSVFLKFQSRSYRDTNEKVGYGGIINTYKVDDCNDVMRMTMTITILRVKIFWVKVKMC